MTLPDLKAVQLIKQGRIGEIQFCEGNFGSYFQANQWRLTRAMGGGGPLMDMRDLSVEHNSVLYRG